MRPWRILPLAALTALLACGNAEKTPGVQIASQLFGGLVRGATGAPSAAASDPRVSLTREMIDAAGQPLLLVVVQAINAAATLTQAGTNGDKVTWLSAAGQSITVQGDLVIATRALGYDLMALDAPGGVAAIVSGQPTTRRYEYLDGNDQISSMSVTCVAERAGTESLVIYERNYATVKHVETCAAAGGNTFQNTYWLGPDGRLRKSVQWISFGVGTIELTRVAGE